MSIKTSTVAYVRLKCPRDDREVTLHKDCLNCNFYLHWGIKGHKILVTCKPDKVKAP